MKTRFVVETLKCSKLRNANLIWPLENKQPLSATNGPTDIFTYNNKSSYVFFVPVVYPITDKTFGLAFKN